MKKKNVSYLMHRARCQIFQFSIFLMLFLGFQMNAYSHIQQKKVTLDFTEAGVKRVFDEIQHQTEMHFIFNNELTRSLEGITINVKDEELEKVLDRIFEGTGLTYKIREDIIVVMHKMQQENQKEIFITGKVTDEKKLPLPGVTVSIKGLSLGTTTNVQGDYRLRLPDLDKITLIFSFIGMETTEVVYKGNDTINVVMVESAEELQEVVITGYQEIDPRHLTSAVTTLKMDDIMVPGVNTIDRLLEGQVPGLIFMQNSGQIGATPRMRIRGTSSVLGNQEPLWVLDGVILNDPVNVDVNDLNDLDYVNLLGNAIAGLNPHDIEQIDILKDAAATALYGARAANGVIVLTSKKGKAGPPLVSYSFSGNYAMRPRYNDKAVYVMNSKERVALSRELMEKGIRYGTLPSQDWMGYEKLYVDFFTKGLMTYEEFEKQSQYFETVNTDWFKFLTQDAFSDNHSLSISGGSDASRYYISASYNNEVGNIIDEKLKRYSISLRNTINYNDYFTIQAGVNASQSNKKYAPSELSLMNYAYSTSRALPMYDEDGELWYYQKNNQPFNIRNEMLNSEYSIEQKSLSFNLNLNYRLVNGFKFSGNVSYALSWNDEETWYSHDSHKLTLRRTPPSGGQESATSPIIPDGDEIKVKNTKNTSYNVKIQVDYGKNFGRDNQHLVNIAGGWEISSSKYFNTETLNYGFQRGMGKLYSTYNLMDVTEKFSEWQLNNHPEETETLTNLVSGYATLTYGYKNKYIFNVNARTDFSNAFGDRSNEKFLPIWSVSGRWNISDDILKTVNWVENLALKTSYGLQGNMKNDQPTRMIIERHGYNSDKEGNISTVYKYPNPDLKWETTHSFNVGLDFSFFDNKINGGISYYYKKTIDAFLDKTVSNVNGVTSYVVNKGNIENQGMEIYLNLNPVKSTFTAGGKRGFSWRIDPQLGQALNKIINKTLSSNHHSITENPTISSLIEGKAVLAGVPLNTFYSFRFDKLDAQGRPTFKGLEIENIDDLREKYMNMETLEIIFELTEKSGRRVPVIQGGISNHFSYRNFTLNIHTTYNFGNKVRLFYLTSGAYSSIRPDPMRNVRREFVNRWQYPGDEKHTNIPAMRLDETYTSDRGWIDDYRHERWPINIFPSNIYEAYDASDIRVVSGNYFKINNVSFSYFFNRDLIKHWGISDLSISITGGNIYTFCAKELRGQSPEQFGGDKKIELSLRPRFTFGLNLNF